MGQKGHNGSRTQRSKAFKAFLVILCLVGVFLILVPLNSSLLLPSGLRAHRTTSSSSSQTLSTSTTTATTTTSPRTQQQRQQQEKWTPKTRAKPCPVNITKAEIKQKSKSQQGEDFELLQSFRGLCNGTYIEMGALNGVRYSNSFLFQKLFGFQGLLVELSPDFYQKAVKNRPNELAVVNAAVCREPGTLHWVSAKKGNGAVNGVWEFASQDYRDMWWKKVQDPATLPTIQCSPLATIMDQHLAHQPRVATTLNNDQAYYYFDFFSLDVEGAEWSVLQSIDWDRTAFGILFFETPQGKPDERKKMVEFMTQTQGYIPYKAKRSKNSLWFKHPDFDRIYGEVPAGMTM